VDVSSLETLIASPSSPGKLTVRAGRKVAQVVVGRIVRHVPAGEGKEARNGNRLV
jgi:hypothetical protein